MKGKVARVLSRVTTDAKGRRLFRLAAELHDGDEAAARAWLNKPAPALDGETPLDHADTEAGAREVERLIGRLEHGVYT